MHVYKFITVFTLKILQINHNNNLFSLRRKTILSNYGIEFPTVPVVSEMAKEVICKMLSYQEYERISCDDLIMHPIFDIRASRILNIKLEGSGNNPLTKSIEKHLMTISDKNYTLVSEHNYL